MNQEDEILIWKYLDGQASTEEIAALLRRAEDDTALKADLEWAKKIDTVLMSDKKYTVSSASRLKILQQIAGQEKTQRFSSQRWMNPGLRLFACFNIGVLLLGLFSSYLIPTNVASDKIIQAWSMFFQLLKSPLIQTFLILCIAVFVLLIFDQLLSKNSQRRLTTPV